MIYCNDYCKDIKYFTLFGVNDAYYLIVNIIFTAVLNICFFQTNYYFMPTTLVVSDVLSSFADWVVNVLLKKETFVLSLIGYIINIFGSLVYTEIIILHFCTLDFYTKGFL